MSSVDHAPVEANDDDVQRGNGQALPKDSMNSIGSAPRRNPFNLRLVTFVLALTSLIAPARLDEHDHEYKNNEEVILWMNTVGPYHNRQETYSYFSLPFCKGSKPTIGHYHETLGEALQVRTKSWDESSLGKVSFVIRSAILHRLGHGT